MEVDKKGIVNFMNFTPEINMNNSYHQNWFVLILVGDDEKELNKVVENSIVEDDLLHLEPIALNEVRRRIFEPPINKFEIEKSNMTLFYFFSDHGPSTSFYKWIEIVRFQTNSQ